MRRKPTPHELRKLSADSDCDVRAVQRVLAGQRTRDVTRRVVLEAVARLGWGHLVASSSRPVAEQQPEAVSAAGA